MDCQTSDHESLRETLISREFVVIFNHLRCRNEEEWSRMHEIADNHNDPLAQATLAIGYSSNMFYCKNIAKSAEYGRLSLSWLQRLSDRNAYFCLGIYFSEGIVISKDPSRAASLFEKGTEIGCPLCCCSLGFRYSQAKDDAKTFQLFHLAAEQHYAVAQVNVGLCFQNGVGCNKDFVEALRWFHLAADQGYPDAFTCIGWLHDMGNGVEMDERKATEWYFRAAEIGDPVAQNNLGIKFKYGKHGDTAEEIDFIEAVTWYQKAAVQGHAGAQNSLGACYQNGEGVAEDIQEAVNWFRASAESGNKFGQFNLGALYEVGHGVDQNLDEAERLYSLSSAQGHPSATSALKKLGRYKKRGNS